MNGQHSSAPMFIEAKVHIYADSDQLKQTRVTWKSRNYSLLPIDSPLRRVLIESEFSSEALHTQVFSVAHTSQAYSQKRSADRSLTSKV